jgi:hypothetical protein
MGIWAGTSSTATEYNIVNGGAGADTVTFSWNSGVSASATTVTNLLRENMTDFTAGDVALTSADQTTSGFTSVNVTLNSTVVTSRINLTGATFVTAASTNINTAIDNGAGNTLYTGAATVVATGASMANLQNAGNIGGVIFVATDVATTASFTAQAGIAAAVTYITGTIGTSGNVGNENAMIAVNNGTDTALFHYVEGATVSAGIQASELTLVGVLHNTTGLTALNFS